jgi:hypothetical protein
VVLAGSHPNDPSPLLKKTGVTNKALIPLANKLIISYVLDAICHSKLIQSIYLVGLKHQDIQVSIKKPISFLPGTAKRSDNLLSTLNYLNGLDNPPQHVIIISSDIPLITPEIIDQCILLMNIPETNKDAYFGIIPKDVMENSFPGANKRFPRLKEGIFCGGDINAVRISTILSNETLVRNLFKNRKSMVKMILRVSPRYILRYVTRRLSIVHIIDFFKNEFDADVTHYINPFAEAGMDLDYPEQLDRFENLMTSRRSI